MFEKIKGGIKDFRDHWNTPREGEYVSGKEIVNITLGSTGSNGVDHALEYIGFTASCYLVGAIYNISFMHIYIISLLTFAFTYIFSPINMILQDNEGRPPQKTMRIITIVCIAIAVVGMALFFVPQEITEHIIPALPQLVGIVCVFNVFCVFFRVFMYRKLCVKYGKFKPWVLVCGIPCIAFLILMAFLPFNTMTYGNKLWVLFSIFQFYDFFKQFIGQKDNIERVMTPNTEERSRFMTIEQFVSSALSGIPVIFIPMLASLTGGMTSLNTFRFVIPGMAIAYTPLVLFQVFGVKERVILEKEHKPDINMKKGFKSVLKNKYLWITNISGLLGNISAGVINIVSAMFIYALRQDWMLGIVNAVLAIAGTPGLLLVPFLVKKIGKRNTVLMGKLFMLVGFGVMLIGCMSNNIALVLIGQFIHNVFSIIPWMLSKLMLGDIWDYQQYITGERLEACAGIFSLITDPLAKLMCMIIPALYLSIGFSSDWNILYFADVRQKVFLYTVLACIVSHVVGTIPYFFYDFSEKKHKEIMAELKKRADSIDGNSEEIVQEDKVAQPEA